MMTDSTLPPIANTIPRAVERSGCGRSVLYEAIKRGDLPIVKVGRRTLILEDDLQQWVRRYRVSEEAA
jgi:excisionase family DNA binding protein